MYHSVLCSLVHPNTVLFVSHCGMNGVLESLYHRVPLLAMPIFGDQPDNAARIVERGLGLALDRHTLTEEAVTKAIRKILDDPKWAEFYNDVIIITIPPCQVPEQGELVCRHVERPGQAWLWWGNLLDRAPYQVWQLSASSDQWPWSQHSPVPLCWCCLCLYLDYSTDNDDPVEDPHDLLLKGLPEPQHQGGQTGWAQTGVSDCHGDYKNI